MSNPYDAKSSSVSNVQLKAQRLVLAFEIVGNATPASKSSTVDDPNVLFLRLEGQDNITSSSGALDSGESVSYTDSPSDSGSQFNCLVKISEPIKKVLSCRCMRRSTTQSDADDSYIVSLGDADGISPNGDKILLTVKGAQTLASGTHDLTLEVEYSIDEQA